MGIGSKPPCGTDIIGIANQYLGTSYDTILAVFEHLDSIKLVAENLELKQGIQGNTPSIRTNADNSYTIFGYNGEVTIYDGAKGDVGTGATISEQGNVITITDGAGNSISFSKGYVPVKGIDYFDGVTPQLGVDYVNGVDGSFVTNIFKNSTAEPSRPVGGSHDGEFEVIPTGWTDDVETPNINQSIWVSTRKYRKSGTVFIGGDWTLPQRFTGQDGKTPVKGVDFFDGVEGSFSSYVYVLGKTQPDSPIGGSYNGVEVIPVGWFDDPLTPTSADEFLWISATKYVSTESGFVNNGWTIPAK